MNLSIRRLISVLLVCLLPFPSAIAQDAIAGQDISLAQAIRLTLDNNPQFRTYQLRSDALLGELDSAEQKPAMRLNTEIENVLGTGDLSYFQGTELSLSLSQVIEIGDKRAARVSTVSQRQNLLYAQQKILELDMLSEAAARFIELAAAEETQRLLSRSSALASDIYDSVSERVLAGRAPEADRARAAADLALAELAQQSATYTIDAARLRLASLWGNLRPSFQQTQSNLLQVSSGSDINSLLLAVESNPAIEVFASEERLREAQLNEARSMSRGNIELGAGIRHLAELNDTALMFQFSMPLSSNRQSRGAVTTAQANLLRVDSERDTALLNMKAQLLALDQQRQLAANEFIALQRKSVV